MFFLFVFSFILYFSGLFNCILLNNKNLLSFLIASEFMFLGIDFLFIGSSFLLNNPNSLIYSVLFLMITVGESVVGLGLCVLALKLEDSINFSDFSKLKY